MSPTAAPAPAITNGAPPTPADDPLLEQQVRDLIVTLGTKQGCSQLNGCPMVDRLASLGRPAAPWIIEAYRRSQGDAWWRFRLLEVLGRVGGAPAEQALIATLNDDLMPPARAEAARALGRGGIRAGLPALRAVASSSPAPPVSVRLACAYALARMRDRVGEELLEALLVIPEAHAPAPAPGARSVNVDTRWNELRPGLWAVGELRLSRFLPVVEAASRLGEPFTRRDAVEALGKLRQLAAVPALIRALDDELPSTRKLAQAALEAVSGEQGRHGAASWQAWWDGQAPGPTPEGPSGPAQGQ